MKVVQKVGRLKKKSGIAVGKYFEIAALEKMQRENETFLITRTIPIGATSTEMAIAEALTKSTKAAKK